MTKILVNPKNIDHIEYLNNTDIDGYIVGINEYSIYSSLKIDINNFNDINFNNKEVYILLNKSLYNKDIDNITKLLIKLSKLNIKGVFFEDVAIYNINKNLKLNLSLIWNQLHLPTNYLTCNYWSSKGVKGVYLSSELMIEDFINNKKETNMFVFVNIYGYIPIFESSRILLTNYFNFINKDKTDDFYYIKERVCNKFNIIYEEYDNTFILDDKLNGINSFNMIINNKIDYIVLNSLFIDIDEFNSDLNDYLKVRKGTSVNKEDTYTGFLHKESIFKVKSDD